MEVMKKQAERFGTRFITKNITKVDFSSKPLKVWEGNNLYQAHAVIIATGASAKWLGLESEKVYSGRGVSACATCDGAFFKNVDVAVVGGGDTAMEEALFMTRYASKVYVIHRRDEFRASKIMAERVTNHPKIQVIWNSEISDIRGDNNVKSIQLKNLKTGAQSEVQVEGVFIAIGHQPNSEIFSKFIDTESNGYLKVKHGSSYTNIDGVFAAGDIHDHIYRQAITAAGAGCMAAIDAERWLDRHGL
jgi:thioredoxin reductase (NADPH)